ncbi:MAG: 4Fe-4S binding protein [Bacteroidales bacterium]
MLKPSLYSTTRKTGKTLLLMFPMILLIFVFISGGQPNFSGVPEIAAFFITFIFFCYLFFMMLYKGKTDRYRSIGFIVLSLFFALTFIVNLIKLRGSMTFSNENLLSCEIPFCHIVTTMIIIPAAIKQSIIFPGSILEGFAAIGSMLVIVIGISISIGRGFCSWGCFYGGWDEGTSRILKKPVIKEINPVFRWMSFAVLIIIALISAVLLSPFYCDWLCPFKAVTEFEKVTTVEILMKTIVFVSLFLGLVIVLPMITKKRIQCATFCPMGALLSLTNKINIFEVGLDKEKCTNCNLCVKACPTMSISKNDFSGTTISMTCIKCGKCIDTCNKNALHFHVKGTEMNKHFTLSRNLFLFPAFTLLVIFTGGTMQNGILLLYKLFTTGSLI